jgi:hypothetical protein
MKPIIPLLVGCLVISTANADEPDGLENQKGTLNHLRQLFLGLYEFNTQHGTYPSDQTAAKLKQATGTDLTLAGDSSNAYFRQLFVSDIVKSERVFQFAATSNPADNDWSTAETALAQGECEFAYVKGADSNAHGQRPIIVAPMLPGQLKFDPEVLGGRAIVLSADGAARAHLIDNNGDVIVDGKKLFDPEQPFWQGEKPEVALPE